ncbi:Fic family protein [Leucobacter sp. OH2974_COT-288]|nr:Fic family protein [Leucobacter sp. OH2974_COT-288]
MSWDPQTPYNELPLLPPEAAPLETVPILKAVAEARAAVSALNQAVQRIPNPTVLLNTLPLLEAQASSEIENIVTTTDELFRYEYAPEDSASPEVKETLRYRSAVFTGAASIKERALTTATAIEVCSTIKNRDMRLRDLPGTIIANAATKRAIYTPPTGQKLIKGLMSNWEHFIHARAELDPLVILAAQHYQFEAIHPFADGNGRTGRILNVLLLMDTGLLAAPVLYLSRYIIKNKSEYYRLLLDVTKNAAWEEWILFILRGIQETALETLAKIDAIEELQQQTKQTMRDLKGIGANFDLLDLLFEVPYTRIKNVEERCNVSRQTAARWLKSLVDAGILRELRAGRELLFINYRFIDVLAAEATPAI